jgi:hypothetical protein
MVGTVRIPRREGFGSLVDCLADKVDMRQMAIQDMERPSYVDVFIWFVAPTSSSQV